MPLCTKLERFSLTILSPFAGKAGAFPYKATCGAPYNTSTRVSVILAYCPTVKITTVKSFIAKAFEIFLQLKL
jgi:hypothetical protein